MTRPACSPPSSAIRRQAARCSRRRRTRPPPRSSSAPMTAAGPGRPSSRPSRRTHHPAPPPTPPGCARHSVHTAFTGQHDMSRLGLREPFREPSAADTERRSATRPDNFVQLNALQRDAGDVPRHFAGACSAPSGPVSASWSTRATSQPAALAAAASAAKCSSARPGRSGSEGTRSSTTPVWATANRIFYGNRPWKLPSADARTTRSARFS
jgi:hypothetical protein